MKQSFGAKFARSSIRSTRWIAANRKNAGARRFCVDDWPNLQAVRTADFWRVPDYGLFLAAFQKYPQGARPDRQRDAFRIIWIVVDRPQRDPSTAAAGFKQAIANLGIVSFAFGGGCFLDMAFV